MVGVVGVVVFTGVVGVVGVDGVDVCTLLPVFSVVAPGDNGLNPFAFPVPEHALNEMLGILDVLNMNPIPY